MVNKVKKWLRPFLGRLLIRRTTVLSLVFVLMAFILIRQLFTLQIIQGEDYIDSFVSRTTKTRVLKSARGKIYDRNGVVLADNVLSYSVTLEDNGSYQSSRQKNLTLNGIAYRVIKILERNGDTISPAFHVILDAADQYVYDVQPGFTLSRFKADIYGYPLIDDMTEEEKNSTAEEMMARLTGPKGFSIVLEGSSAYTQEELEKAHLPQELSRKEILQIAIIRYQLSTNSFKKYMPVTIATGVSEESVAAIMENQSELQGIEIVEDSTRTYIDSLAMSPILGYTGKASAEELASLRKQRSDYANDAVVGKAGIEQVLELSLQGTEGRETVTVDNLGKVLHIEDDTQVDPIAGNDVTLTIDSDWQDAIYEILKQRVAGILLNKIDTSKTFEYELVQDAAQIRVPIYDAFINLVANSIVDISLFSREDASEVEKKLYKAFLLRQDEIFSEIRGRLTAANPPALGEEDEEMNEYLSYIGTTLLKDTLGILSPASIDTTDSTYLAWTEKESISLKDYLTYAASQNWLDFSVFSPEGDYLDSLEVYEALSAYIIDYLRTDTGFSKLIYKYMILDDEISGAELCLTLYEQGFLDKKEDEDVYNRLLSGAMGGYDFIINKLSNLQIEPADLALTPCSASAVICDVHSGDVLACVSYPGYDSNRLANTMDTDYYAKLALSLSSPFFNKATQQLTAPGSTMKLLSTIAGFGEGVLTDSTYFTCGGAFEYVSPPINCWSKYGHGSIEIREAIEQSCNVFFSMVGFQVGKLSDNQFSEAQSLKVLKKYATQIGLADKSGIEISEASPQVSDKLAVPSYIGQGTHLYSTAGLCRYAAALANSGTVYKLSLVDQVTAPNGNVIEDRQPEVINQMNVAKNVWEDIHDGMYRVVATHNQFDTLGMSVSGKTGTAEIDIYHPNHGLFIGFAPSDDPQVAIAVRVANGYTSGNACLIAADIFKYIFGLADRDTIITGLASEDTSDTSND